MKSQQEKFRFRKLDNIGAIEAEGDEHFLRNCFVDTGELSVLQDCGDSRSLVVGRTGFGKTALLNELAANEERAIVVRPESLALAYVSNSTVLNFMMQLGVNLDTFFRLLWRHVFTVEILKTHFHIKSEADKLSFFDKLFRNVTADRRKQRALEYLENWGRSFWEETEYRIREVTTKFEEELSASVKQRVPAISFSAEGAQKLSSEEKHDVIQRAQFVVNKVQVRELTEILEMLKDVLTDRQKRYYIVIDRLDENWIEDRLRFRLIRALIETIRDFRQIPNTKIVAAIRLDLLDRVFRLTRDPGFQEEKFESIYIKLQWTRAQLISVLEKRINFLIQERYTKEPVCYRDILPKNIGKHSGIDYMLDRTMMRPRGIILFFNLCIPHAEGRATLTADIIRKAEGEYSRNRLRSLADEWHADYPNLLRFTPLLRQDQNNSPRTRSRTTRSPRFVSITSSRRTAQFWMSCRSAPTA